MNRQRPGAEFPSMLGIPPKEGAPLLQDGLSQSPFACPALYIPSRLDRLKGALPVHFYINAIIAVQRGFSF